MIGIRYFKNQSKAFCMGRFYDDCRCCFVTSLVGRRRIGCPTLSTDGGLKNRYLIFSSIADNKVKK